MRYDILLGFVLAFIIYVGGTASVYKIANVLMNDIAPWVGVLCGVVYIMVISLLFMLASHKVS